MSAYDGLPGDWQLVVGLEVHVELATATKMFSASPNRFGGSEESIGKIAEGTPGATSSLGDVYSPR